jgi:hypothetical protein
MVEDSRGGIIDAEVEAIAPAARPWRRTLQAAVQGPLVRVGALTLAVGVAVGLALPYLPGMIAARYFPPGLSPSGGEGAPPAAAPDAAQPELYSPGATAASPEENRTDPALAIWPADSGKTADPRLQELTQRLQAMEARLAARPGPDPALTGRLNAIEQNLAKLNEGPQRAVVARRTAIVQAVARLRAALPAGRPYVMELAQVESQQMEGQGEFDPQALAVLRAGAADGMPALARLQREFPAAVQDAIRAERLAPAATWWQAAANRLAASVTVRRVGEVDGDAADAVLARAERRLGAGDVAAALAELDALSGAPAAAPAIIAWRQAAARHVAILAAMARLDDVALAALAAATGEAAQ